MKSKPWLGTEDDFIRKNYKLLGVLKTSKALKRTPGSVAHRASRIGVHHNGVKFMKFKLIDGYPWVTMGMIRGAIHRLVAEAKYQRQLGPGDVVHHVDGNVWNIHPDNLELTTRHEHPARRHPHIVDNLKGSSHK